MYGFAKKLLIKGKPASSAVFLLKKGNYKRVNLKLKKKI